MHRSRLLGSQIAVCYYCFAEFPPSAITEWCDAIGEEQGQTAICPQCSVDAVVGFNGPVDAAWVQAAHQKGFG